MKDQLYKVIVISATVAYFIPVLIVLYKRLWRDRCFLSLGIYWLVGGVMNVITSLPGIRTETLEIITLIYNMADIPFILWILWYTSSSSSLAKLLKRIIIMYSVVEVIIVLQSGLSYDSIKYVMGIGVLAVIITLAWEITLCLQRIEHTNRERSMLFIYAALLFEYGSYIIVYIFEYFIIPADPVDNLLIYYTSTLVAVTIASFGFLSKKNKEALAFR